MYSVVLRVDGVVELSLPSLRTAGVLIYVIVISKQLFRMCLNKYIHIVCTFHGLYLSIVLNFRVQIHSAVKDLPLITPTEMTSGSIMETEVL